MDMKDPFDIASECVAFGVRRASRLATGHFDRYLAASGMRSTQFTILNALRALQEVSLTELAAQLETDRTTLTRNLRLLQDKGWVSKSPGSDRRSRILTLTREGLASLELATVAWQEAQSSLTDRLGGVGYRTLMSSLEDLEEALSG
jgi:DNA-binding MarR family transcriptional regulator